jgi:acetyl esterase/lipase
MNSQGMTILTRTPPAAQTRVAYGAEALQFGDLRLPQRDASTPWPVVVVIHGGFWRARYDLEHIGHLCAALTEEAGVATWSLQYRRVGQPGGGWPGTFQDVTAGTQFVTQLASEYGFDLDRVVTIGHSAGGHLALWAASETKVPRGAVSLAGVADLRHAADLRIGDGAVQAFLGGEPADVPERYAAASPYERLPMGVPQVLVHGTDDDTVPFTIAERYAEAAKRAGDDIRLVTLEGTGHFELIDPLTDAWPAVRSAVESLV